MVDHSPHIAPRRQGGVTMVRRLLGASPVTYLADVSHGRDNNFNLIRIIAAFAVLVSHSMPIALGAGAVEPLSSVLGISLGTFAVYAFFAISGFLIAASFDHSRSLVHWISARALRIFPALFVVLVLTVLLLGPLTTTLPILQYFTDAETIRYVPQNLMLVSPQYALPGVFDGNPFQGVINGSLWTLFYEVACYGGVAALGFVGALRSRWRLGLILCLYLPLYALIASDTVAVHYKIGKLAELSLPFAIGTTFYVFRHAVPLHWTIGAALVALAAGLHGTGLFEAALVLALSYGVLVLAYMPGRTVRRYNSLGDYSYGVYIFAFPTQQLLVFTGLTVGPAANMLLAGVLTLGCAVLSWHFVEGPALAARERVVAALTFLRARTVP